METKKKLLSFPLSIGVRCLSWLRVSLFDNYPQRQYAADSHERSSVLAENWHIFFHVHVKRITVVNLQARKREYMLKDLSNPYCGFFHKPKS